MESTENRVRIPWPRENDLPKRIIAATGIMNAMMRANVVYISAIPPATAARPVAFCSETPENAWKSPKLNGINGVQARTMPQMNHVLLRS